MERRKPKINPPQKKQYRKKPRYIAPTQPARGRPTDYHPRFAPIARNLRMLGMTIPQIAEIMDISPASIWVWRKEHPEFSEAWDQGGAVADGRVVSALYERALGYTHPEEKIFFDSKTGEIVRADTLKHYPPDTQAISLWLSNRLPKLWKTSRSASELGGPDGEPLPPPIIVVEGIKPGQRIRTVDGSATEIKPDMGNDDEHKRR